MGRVSRCRSRDCLRPTKRGSGTRAIRPYPRQYVSRIRLKEGAHFTLRPIQPEDEEMLIAFHSTLSQKSVHFRYFGSISLEARIDHGRLARICFSDYEREIAIVAEHGLGAARRVVAVGRLNRLHRRNQAEFAVVVSDAWQGRGLGTHLLEKLIQIGREEKLEAITGSILRENIAMLRICHHLGFQIYEEPDSDTATAALSL